METTNPTTLKATKKFLDKDGLTVLWGKINGLITNKIGELDSIQDIKGDYVDIYLEEADGKITTLTIDDSNVVNVLNDVNFDNTTNPAGDVVKVSLKQENGKITGITVTDNIGDALDALIESLPWLEQINELNFDNSEDPAGEIVKVTLVQEKGKITTLTVTDTIVDTITNELKKLNASFPAENATANTYVNGSIKQENAVITEFAIDDSGISDYIDTLNYEEEIDGNHVSIGVKQEKGKITSVTIDDSSLDDIKSSAELFSETFTVEKTDNKITNVTVNSDKFTSSVIDANSIDSETITSTSIESTTSKLGSAEADSISVSGNIQGAAAVITNNAIASDFVIGSGDDAIKLSNVNTRVSDIEGLINSDNNTIINKLNEVIEFFEGVSTEETGVALLSQVCTNTQNIDNLYDATIADNGAHTHTIAVDIPSEITSSFSGKKHSHTFTGDTNQETSTETNHTHTYEIPSTITSTLTENDHSHNVTNTETDSSEAGTHTHEYQKPKTIVSEFTGTENQTTSSEDDHFHGFLPTGTVTSDFTGTAHDHEFTGTENQTTSETGSHNHSYTPEGTISDDGTHGHDITISADSSNVVDVSTSTHIHIVSETGSHNHSYTPEGTISDDGTHSHTVDASEDTVEASASTHTHAIGEVSAHKHNVTATGNVGLVGNLVNGVLEITAVFTGTSCETSEEGAHAHTIDASADTVTASASTHIHTISDSGSHNHTFTGTASVVDSNGDHSHTYTAAGTISETTAAGTIESTFTGTANQTTDNAGGHSHTYTSEGTVTTSITEYESIATSETGAHVHKYDKTTAIVGNKTNATVESVISTYEDKTTSESGEHNHTYTAAGTISEVTATGTVSTSIKTKSTETLTTSENGSHIHDINKADKDTCDSYDLNKTLSEIHDHVENIPEEEITELPEMN